MHYIGLVVCRSDWTYTECAGEGYVRMPIHLGRITMGSIEVMEEVRFPVARDSWGLIVGVLFSTNEKPQYGILDNPPTWYPLVVRQYMSAHSTFTLPNGTIEP